MPLSIGLLYNKLAHSPCGERPLKKKSKRRVHRKHQKTGSEKGREIKIEKERGRDQQREYRKRKKKSNEEEEKGGVRGEVAFCPVNKQDEVEAVKCV